MFIISVSVAVAGVSRSLGNSFRLIKQIKLVGLSPKADDNIYN